jgi:hypothetical protein
LNVIVLALLCFMKLSEMDSIGTSLAALIPPVGLLGALEYHAPILAARMLLASK